MACNRHLFFAWVFVINGSACPPHAAYSGHLTRDLPLRRRAWRNIGRPVIDRLLFRHPTSEAAKRHNVLQNLACLVVISGLLPLIVVAGMAMSHRLDAVYPGSVDLLGGRQSAHTLHFLAATGLLVFVLAHVFEVLVGGVWNRLRSMVTGGSLPADRRGQTPRRSTSPAATRVAPYPRRVSRAFEPADLRTF